MVNTNFKFVVADVRKIADAWFSIAVIAYDGAAAMDQDEEFPGEISEDQQIAIFKFLRESGAPFSSVREEGHGRPFADPPGISLYDKHIIVTQSGGRDV